MMKKDIAQANEEKFLQQFKIQRPLHDSEIEELFNHKPGDKEVRPGVEVPLKSENVSFYLTDEGFALIKSEPYDGLEHADLKHILDFCENKKWKFSIHQGLESHSPGRTLALVFATGFKPKVRSGMRKRITVKG